MIEKEEQKNRVQLVSIKAEFVQEPNCLSEQNIDEQIEIELLSDTFIDSKEHCFVTIKTDKWSMDSVQELEELINKLKKAI